MVASTAVVGMLGLMLLPLPGELAAYDVSARWTDATALWLSSGWPGRSRSPGERPTRGGAASVSDAPRIVSPHR